MHTQFVKQYSTVYHNRHFKNPASRRGFRQLRQLFARAGYSATTFSLNLSGWNTSRVTNMANMLLDTGHNASSWTVRIPQTNGGGITNTTQRLYGRTTSVYATPRSDKSFTRV